MFTKFDIKNIDDNLNENRLIITIEWIMEESKTIFIGLFVILFTILVGTNNAASKYIYWISSITLFSIAAAFSIILVRVIFSPYRLRPVISIVS
ncbi:MAG: hypothetical protein ACFFAN_09650 [Promethearchaeota archaeon]